MITLMDMGGVHKKQGRVSVHPELHVIDWSDLATIYCAKMFQL